MKPQKVILSLIFVLALFAFFILKRWHVPRSRELFDRNIENLIYSRHALCRMDCRHISKEEINEIMKIGIINLNESRRNRQPCPTFALQGTTSGGQRLRVIFAQCKKQTKVVTCYNLDRYFECHCPGDDN